MTLEGLDIGILRKKMTKNDENDVGGLKYWNFKEENN